MLRVSGGLPPHARLSGFNSFQQYVDCLELQSALLEVRLRVLDSFRVAVESRSTGHSPDAVPNRGAITGCGWQGHSDEEPQTRS